MFVAFSSTKCHLTMTDDSQKNFDEELAERLRDPAKRMKLWQWMNSGYSGGHNFTTSSGMTHGTLPHLTSSGTNGAEPPFPPFSGTFPGPLVWWMMPPCLPFFVPFSVPPTISVEPPAPQLRTADSNPPGKPSNSEAAL